MKDKARVIQRTEYPHIVKVAGVLGGEAIIEGTRIAVWHIVGYYYKVGMSVEDILAEWDYLMSHPHLNWAWWKRMTMYNWRLRFLNNELSSR